MKKSLLIRIHLYCGLFTVFYLIVFGLSSILLNHNIKVENTAIVSHRTAEITVDHQLSDDELAESAKNQLGLMGWLLPWENQRDEAQFYFKITHPGRDYHLNLDLQSGVVDIGEAPKGFLAIIHGLHFFNGQIPNGPLLIKSWMVYQWLTLLVMLISLVIGLWLWIQNDSQKWEKITFGSVLVLSLVLMMMI